MQRIAEVRKYHETVAAANDIMILDLSLTRHVSFHATGSAYPSGSPTSIPTVASLTAALADGSELFAMAKAIPRLQTLDGMSFKLRLHLHNFTFYQTDMMDLLLQHTSLSEV